jgi:hypothetical protein
MTRNTISTLLPNRRGSHFIPLHSLDSLDSPDSLIFFLPENGTGTPQAAGNLPGEIESSKIAIIGLDLEGVALHNQRIRLWRNEVSFYFKNVINPLPYLL